METSHRNRAAMPTRNSTNIAGPKAATLMRMKRKDAPQIAARRIKRRILAEFTNHFLMFRTYVKFFQQGAPT